MFGLFKSKKNKKSDITSDLDAVYSIIENAPLYRINGENDVEGDALPACELWRDLPCVVAVVRRPGCLLCREEAAELAKVCKSLDAPSKSPAHMSGSSEPTQLLSSPDGPRARFIAVLSETTSADGFMSVFDGGEVYLDTQNAFKIGLGNRKARMSKLFSRKFVKNYRRATRNYPQEKGDLKGDTSVMGGLYVIKPGNPGEIVFVHKEDTFGDIPSMAAVMATIEQIHRSTEDDDFGESESGSTFTDDMSFGTFDESLNLSLTSEQSAEDFDFSVGGAF